MQQRMNFVTLGVNNLDKMKDFYQTKFGWTPINDNDGIVFFKLNGVILALFPAHELAKDIGIPHDGQGFKRFTLAVNFRSEQEVNEIFNVMRERGVTIMKEPVKVFWGGYSGYVADIENNYWEFAYNPFLALDDEGSVVGHQ